MGRVRKQTHGGRGAGEWDTPIQGLYYGDEEKGFAELVDDPRWYRISEEDAVDMLRKRMTNYGTKAKKLWMRQNAREVIAEYQKLVRQQEGR